MTEVVQKQKTNRRKKVLDDDEFDMYDSSYELNLVAELRQQYEVNTQRFFSFDSSESFIN